MSRSPRRSRRSTAALTALLLALLLALTACGSSGSSNSAATTGSSAAGQAHFPVTVTGANGRITVPGEPTSIVSMSATATEMLFAIGAGSQVKAVDSTSNYPTTAPITKLSAFTPNAEAIVAYHPDLVVLSDDMNGIVKSLAALKVPTLQLTAAKSLDDTYSQLNTLGDATGHSDKAGAVVADMRQRITKAVASVPAEVKGEKVYHELDQTYYSATSSTFIGGIYTMFGLDNIADGAPKAGSGYPQLSAEYVVGQKPDLIVLADTVCCQQTAALVAKRPAFDTIPAVKDHRILEVNDDVASRWGPRVADLVESIAQALRG
ncbi:MAG TPA: ABC transporter substrate-binding protein [Blastococcus sp.]|nr:ABC transporter substrate-binding protein [Blastococcus sp.]